MSYKKVSEEEMEKIRAQSYENLSEFEKRFFNNLDLLIARVNKLKVLKSGTLDHWTYYDAILAQIRAMFIETPNRKEKKKNYTVQNYLISIGQKEIAEEIDNYLSKELYEGITFREAIKVSVDKFIAHYDEVDNEDVVVEQMCRAILTEPNEENNISNILIEFMQLLLRGTIKTWGNSCSACLDKKNK